MSNDKTCKYRSIKIPEKEKGFLSYIHYSPMLKILETKFGEKYNNKEIKALFNANDLQKSFGNLRKMIKKDIPVVTDEDLRSIEKILLDDENILDTYDMVDPSIEHKPKSEISFEEWQKTLQDKYENLRETTFKNFSDVWQAIEFTLSVKNVLHIKGNTLPFAGIILGRPSSSKTLALEMLRGSKHTFYTDSFTAKSFVSHNSAVSQEQLKEIDMLPRIKNRLFLTPELAPLFSAKDEDLLNVLGIVTRILDGHGYESDSGVYGHRGYNEEIMFSWVGAAVDIPRKVYKHLSQLGPKLYFIRMVTKKVTEEQYLLDLKYGNFNESKEKVQKALLDYLKWFEYCPIAETETNLMKIACEPCKDDDYSLKVIIRLGNILSHLRAVAPTWDTKGTQGSDYAYSPPSIESPKRAITNLTNLARGHALSQGRLSITIDDIPMIIKVVLSTAPVERVMVFDLLLNKNGKLTKSEIVEYLNVSGPTALRTMTELKALGLVDLEQESYEYDNSPKSIKLKDAFKWFLSDEFKRLRKGFVPEKFTIEKEEECKEKSPPPTLKKYDDGEDFDYYYLNYIALEGFKHLETKVQASDGNIPLVDHITLKNYLLQNPLLVGMKITDKVVDRVIQNLLKDEILTKTKEGQYYRSKKDNETNTSAAAIAAA